MTSTGNARPGRPLDGVLVVDLCQFLAGPLASLRLADLGARVVKVERPGQGDAARELWGSVRRGADNFYFQASNRDKESLAADLRDPRDACRVRRLLRRADVVIQNFRPGVVERLGLRYEQVRGLNGRLVYGSVSGYGQMDSWRDRPGQDLLVQARSGLLWLTGSAGGPPVPIGLAVVDQYAAMALAQGILAALYARASSGEGSLVEVSLLESAIDLQGELLTEYLNDGEQLPIRAGPVGAHAFQGAPYGVYQTSDGYLVLAMVPLTQLAEILGAPDLLLRDGNASWDGERARQLHRLAELLSARTTEAWMARLEEAGVWCAEVLSWDDVINADVAGQLAMIQQLARKGGGTLRTTRCPIRLNGERLLGARDAPGVGDQTVALVEEFDLDAENEILGSDEARSSARLDSIAGASAGREPCR